MTGESIGEHTAAADRWWHHIRVRIPPGTGKRVVAVIAALAALATTLGVIDATTEGRILEAAGHLVRVAGLLLAALGWG